MSTPSEMSVSAAGAGAAADTPTVAATRVGHYRWYICALLFFALTINYIDRQVIGILKPTLQQQFGWTELDYSDIVLAFQIAYAIGLVIAGRLMDRLGTRIGFTLAVSLWSLAAMAHAGAVVFGSAIAAVLGIVGLTYSASVAGFIAARFALGLSEAGNFPAAIKTVAEWFPRPERAFATGIFNAGSNVGAMVTPLVVAWVTIEFGWAWAFLATGALGLVWLVAWLVMYRPAHAHPRVSSAELAYIRSDPPDPVLRLSWRTILRHRQAWAFAAAKFMTDPVWWLYLYWIPDFLHRNHGLDLASMGLPIVVIYVVADVGSVAGGWLSSTLIKHGWTVNASRKTTMLVCALAVLPIVFAARASDLWVAVGLISLAAAAHQGWSCNVYTLTSDTFPRPAVGSVVGFGGMAGAVGGMLIAKLTGYLLEFTGSYVPVFLIAASAYLVALAVVHLLTPRLEPVRIAEPAI
jgi:ACS family hexuronate transporter-like MFS transporter